MMLELSRLEKEIKKSVKAFARGEFDKDILMEMARRGEFPFKLQKKAAEIGLLCVQLPEESGGEGLGIAEQAVILEELAFHDSTAGCALASGTLGVAPLLASGNPSRFENVVAPVAKGKGLCSTAFYEKDVQTRYPKFLTTAQKDKDGWLLNGTKTNVLNGNSADFFIVTCQTSSRRTSPMEAPSKGCTMFLVERKREGINITDQGPRLGIEMVSCATLHFSHLRIPHANVIGDEGKGMELLDAYRCSVWILQAALALGMARGAYHRALDYIKQREQFGRKIADFRVSRHKVAQMALRLEVAGLAVRKAALLYDGGGRELDISALARRLSTETAVKVCDEALQLLGGYGYMAEYEIEHFLRDAKTLDLMGGEKTLLLDIIADREMGKR